MVAVLARLQLTLMARGLRQSPARVFGLVLGGVFGLVLVLGILVSFAVMAGNPVADVQALAVGVLSSVVVAWVVLPLLLFGVDATLDPARFALLPLSVRQLRPGLLVAGLVGVPGALTSLLALAPVLGWVGNDTVAAIVALLAAPVFVLTCFLAARTLTSWFASALSSRRFQDFAALVLGLFIVSAGLVTNVVSNRAEDDPGGTGDLARTSADVLAWTPLGWIAAVPGDVAREQWGVAAVRAILSVALVVGLWRLWGRALSRALTSTSEGEGTNVRERSTLADRLYPATPAGAVAARCLRYWRRDPRYSVSLVSMAVLPIMIGVSTSLGSNGLTTLFAMPLLVAAMTGPALVADLAYDYSALWTHVVVGISGRADRLGRVLAMLTVNVPLIVISFAVAVIVNGRWDLALGVLAATIAALLCGLAVGILLGSLYPGQAPPPGTNPFSTKGSGAGVLTMVVFVVAVVGTALVALPVLIPAIVWAPDSVPVQAILLPVSVVWGLLMLHLGVTLGGRRVDKSWPEVFTQVSAQKG